ncbi:MAG: M23 family metallopeptidase [Deltaproteobacteria bacterium]|nr:M23 family metallopeptidase [Deltaproteobacteria bacterium]
MRRLACLALAASSSILAVAAIGACAAPTDADEVVTSADAITTCERPVPDRTGTRVSDLPFQRLNRGALPAAVTALGWTYPTRSRSMPTNFGAGRSYNEGHEGADLGGGRGDPIFAASKGTVVYTLTTCTDNDVRRDIVCGNGWGNHVVISHGNGVFTRYAHLSKVQVKVGNEVDAGATIGALGHSGLSDGPHLHFELGTRATAFAPCAAPQNFDMVHNPAKLTFGGAAPAFTPRWCDVLSSDGVANVRTSPNGDIQNTITNGGRVYARSKNGDWFAVDYSLRQRDWQGFMHTSVLRCP